MDECLVELRMGWVRVAKRAFQLDMGDSLFVTPVNASSLSILPIVSVLVGVNCDINKYSLVLLKARCTLPSVTHTKC